MDSIDGMTNHHHKANVLLLGPIGSGKTWVTRTLLREWPDQHGILHSGAGLDVMYVALEPGLHRVNGDLTCAMGFHYHYIQPTKTAWDDMSRYAKLANSLSMGALEKSQDPRRGEYQQWLELYSTASGFTCDGCNTDFGPVDEWGPDRAFVNDSLSAMSKMALQLICGAKPIKSLPEYLAAQSFIEDYVYKCTGDTRCSFVLLAHLDRIKDEIGGGTYLGIGSIGDKLAPKIAKPFDEIIVASRDAEGRFHWSTNEPTMLNVKARFLPFSSGLSPDFRQVFQSTPRE